MYMFVYVSKQKGIGHMRKLRPSAIDTQPITFRPTVAQRQRIEVVANRLGSPGKLGTAIRWMLENAPQVQTEVNSVTVNRK